MKGVKEIRKREEEREERIKKGERWIEGKIKEVFRKGIKEREGK